MREERERKKKGKGKERKKKERENKEREREGKRKRGKAREEQRNTQKYTPTTPHFQPTYLKDVKKRGPKKRPKEKRRLTG
ncbi:uncharacterized protein OCT59_012917 [Rhizophagus irregularis]|nr:hypothetical protein OCT59_012917 [Rhizophagus irregularis]